MLDHVSITVGDFSKAEPFYDAIMSALSVAKVGRTDSSLGYGDRCGPETPDLTYLSVKLDPAPMPDACQSPDGCQSSVQALSTNSRHWCFKAPGRAAVDAFWSAGIANGGTDDGRPGLRADYHASYYAAFLIDPCGNRVEAVCHLPE